MASSLSARVLKRGGNLSLRLPVRRRGVGTGSFRQLSELVRGDILKLHERGVFQTVFPRESSPELARLLQGGRRCVYCGFDPTASSLHIGNLLAVVALLHCQRAGHEAIVLVGGATAQIGDPSGRTSDRIPLSAEKINSNISSITRCLEKIQENHCQFFWKNKTKELPPLSQGLSTETLAVITSQSLLSMRQDLLTGANRILNNADWYKSHNVVEFLSTIGRYFRMGDMLAKQSVKARLSHPEGMNFTEFTYQVFQSYDWLHLLQQHNCIIQIGGNDQIGNIVAGYEFIKKMLKKNVFGLTVPLVKSSTGDKLGKSAGNSVWLNHEETTPFELYQYFINTPDTDVETYLKLFTFLSECEIKAIMSKQQAQPEASHGQKKLAEQITLLVHGDVGVETAKRWTEALFSKHAGSLDKLSQFELKDLFRNAPTTHLILEPGMTVLDTCLKAKCFSREVDGERIIRSGGVHINHRKVSQPDYIVTPGEHILSNNITLIRVGKKNHYVICWEV